MKSSNCLRSVCFTGLLFLFAVGCATSGKDFPSRTDWIHKSQTKQQDVVSVMGEPFAVGNSGGTPTWTYGFYRYELFGRSLHKELKFYWSPNKTVDHFSFNSSFPGDIKISQQASKE